MGCALEELAGLTESVSNVSCFTAAIAAEMEIQAKLLDALIGMNSEGYIFINSDTDQKTLSSPYKKGKLFYYD